MKVTLWIAEANPLWQNVEMDAFPPQSLRIPVLTPTSIASAEFRFLHTRDGTAHFVLDEAPPEGYRWRVAEDEGYRWRVAEDEGVKRLWMDRATSIVRFVGGPLDGRSLELPDSETVYHMLDAHGEGETASNLPVFGTYHRTGDQMRWTAKETPA